MLGKLFSSAVSLQSRGQPSSSRLSTNLESVQEDIHTRNLLFPDPETLYQHQRDQVFPLNPPTAPILTSSPIPYDFSAEIDLDPKDVRIVVMQDGGNPVVLCDSQPLVEEPFYVDRQSQTGNSVTTSRAGSRGSTGAPRRISLGQASKPVVITQDRFTARSSGAFDRRPSIHARSSSLAESDNQRAAREYREELNVIASCMFGSSELMTQKNTGTKVHIMPTDSRPSLNMLDGGHGSLGRAVTRGSKLAQSFTSENLPRMSGSASGQSNFSRLADKKKVLITRIFAVPLESNSGVSDVSGRQTTASPGQSQAAGYPFPNPEANNSSRLQEKPPLRRKTPMYAIGLIVQLPAHAQLPTSPVSRSAFRGPGSYTEQESVLSSFGSSKPSGWTVLGNPFGVDSLESSITSDIDDRMDAITQHWDIVMRALSHMQVVATKDILALLRQTDLSSPDLTEGILSRSHPRMISASVSVSGKRVEDTAKPHKPPKDKYVQLFAEALSTRDNIKVEVDSIRQRIANGVKILPVMTRQGRWGIWRDEARWVSKWAGGKEEGFFFYNLLTSFLGSHNDWLQALGPDWYRRRHYQQQRVSRGEDLHIPARTVIVAHDKMAARRLVFLLSAFLPANQQQIQPPSIKRYRPSVALSVGGYSQSPPSYMSAQREASLRRRVNKLHAPLKASHTRTMSSPAQAFTENLYGGHDQSHRRDSDAVSLKTANLPIPGTDAGSRKSSAATTTTVTPVTTLPNFPRRAVRGAGSGPRPGSSGSLATDDLMRSLQRGDSTGQYSNGSSESQVTSRWGSLTSFWGPKRRESTTATDATLPPLEFSGSSENQVHHVQGKLAQMVNEVTSTQVATNTAITEDNVSKLNSASVNFPHPEEAPRSPQDSQVMVPGGAFESPVKTSVDADGVIDIDISLPDFLTSSFGSAVSSPSSSGFLSSHGAVGPGLEGFEHYSRAGSDEDAAVNVAGWIPRFHPDFVLQSIPKTEKDKDNTSLISEIKAAMQAEPLPIKGLSLSSGQEESRWVTVASAIVADTINFNIKRIKLRRHVKLGPPTEQEPVSVPNSLDSSGRPTSSHTNFAQSASAGPQVIVKGVLEERFIEEPVISMDDAFIDAVERIIAQSGDSGASDRGSKASSPNSSRSASRVRGHNKTKGHEIAGIVTVGAQPKSETLEIPPRPGVSGTAYVDMSHVSQEVPRNQCKKVLLSALEDIAREVAESQRDDGTGVSPVWAAGESEAETQYVHEHQESFLREGIRAWLRDVADGGKTMHSMGRWPTSW